MASALVYKATLSSFAADGLMSFTDLYGETSQYLPVPANYDEIIIDQDITAVTGTSPTLDTKLKTVINKAGTAPAAGTMDATDGGGTAIAMTQVTAVAREIKSVARKNADADAAGVANIGSHIALYGDVGGTSPTFTGEVFVKITTK